MENIQLTITIPRKMEITVISGDIDTPGSVIEIPWSVGPLGIGPVYKVDPATRKSTKELQRFEIVANEDGTRTLKPLHETGEKIQK